MINGITVWGAPGKSVLAPLVTLQKRVIRILTTDYVIIEHLYAKYSTGRVNMGNNRVTRQFGANICTINYRRIYYHYTAVNIKLILRYLC